MKYLYIVLGFCFLFTRCKKIDVKTPDFDVFLASKSYKVGDTVLFNLTGSVQNIVVFPGDAGFNYDDINRKEVSGKPQLNFTTTLTNPGQTNTLKILASINFNGKYTVDGLNDATWLDITSRAALATSTAAKASGIIDLSDLVSTENKPVYLAVKYLGYQHATLKQPKWVFTTFAVNNVLPNGTIMPVGIAAEMGWVAFNVKNPSTEWTILPTGLINIDGSSVTSLNEDNEDWVISKPLNLKNANPDVGISIKNIGSAKLANYSYIYSKPGTYKVVFIGFNNSVDQRKEVKKEFLIHILP